MICNDLLRFHTTLSCVFDWHKKWDTTSWEPECFDSQKKHRIKSEPLRGFCYRLPSFAGLRQSRSYGHMLWTVRAHAISWAQPIASDLWNPLGWLYQRQWGMIPASMPCMFPTCHHVHILICGRIRQAAGAKERDQNMPKVWRKPCLLCRLRKRWRFSIRCALRAARWTQYPWPCRWSIIASTSHCILFVRQGGDVKGKES